MKRSLLVAAMLLSALLVSETSRAGVASISLSDEAGPPRSRLEVTGSGFAPRERVAMAFDQRVLKVFMASQAGMFSSMITVPSTATPGEHTVSAKGQVSGRATAPFIVRTDWPTFHFDDAKTGENPYENVLDPSNVGDLDVAWAADLSEDVNPASAVVDGVVYAANVEMEVFALDPGDGGVIWRRRLDGIGPSDITVAGGRLYVSSLTGHVMYVLDAATGERLVTVPGPKWAPTVVGGVAYAANSSPDGTLWAFDAITGEEIWAYHTPGGWGFGVGLAVVDGLVITGALNGNVDAYDASTGEQVWTVDTAGDDVFGVPAVVEGVVYAGSDDGNLYAIDAQTGQVLWTAATGAAIGASPAVADGRVHVASEDGHLYAFDAGAGQLLWKVPHDATSMSPAVANGVVYVGSLDHTVYAYGAATGDLLWSYQTGGVAREVIVVDGTVYLGSDDEHLYAFRLPDSSS